MTAARELGGAALLGAVCGMRTFTGPAALALRGRVRPRPVRAALIAAAVGEAVADKTPVVPSRTAAGPLAARVVSGTLSAGAVGGPRGAAAGALAAAGGAIGGSKARGGLARLTGLPDPLLALGEDAVAVAAATLAVRDPSSDGPGSLPARAVLGAARGAVAGLAATTAMTAAQAALRKATGGSPSRTPERAARKVVRRLSGSDVPRNRRDTLNEAAHWLYGTAWGTGLGVLTAARGRPPVASGGAALGMIAWVTSLVELPALGIAPPVWAQPPGRTAADAGLHLVYGLTAAAVLDALP